MKFAVCIVAFTLLFIGSVAADSTPCHACILKGKQWCPSYYSPSYDTSGTCQYSYEYCSYTTVKSTSNCPVKSPSSLTSCTDCTTDSYVWCAYSAGSEYSGTCVSSSTYCSSTDSVVYYSSDCDDNAITKLAGLTIVAFVFLVVILPCLLLIALVTCIVCCCRKSRDPAYVAITTTAPYQQVPAGQPYYAPPSTTSPPPFNGAGQNYQPPQGYQPQPAQGYQPQYGYYNPQQSQPQYAPQYGYAPAPAGTGAGANGMGSLGVASANPAAGAAGSTNANGSASSYYGVQP